MEGLYVLAEDRESFILKITPFFLQSANIRKYRAVALQHRGIVPLTQWLLCKCVLKFSVVTTAGCIKGDIDSQGWRSLWLRLRIHVKILVDKVTCRFIRRHL